MKRLLGIVAIGAALLIGVPLISGAVNADPTPVQAKKAQVSVNLTGDENLQQTAPGGGAPATDEPSEVKCNLLLKVKVARGSDADMQVVTFGIPAGQSGSFDVYYPTDVVDQNQLRIGGDIASIHVCDTPLGKMVRYVAVFNGKGKSRALLPVLGADADGFQVLLVDGKHVIHAVAYTGQTDLDFSK